MPIERVLVIAILAVLLIVLLFWFVDCDAKDGDKNGDGIGAPSVGMTVGGSR